MNIVQQIVNAIINVHPWHTMFVHFPIGLTGAAFLFIVLGRWRRSDSLEHAAFFVITLAALSTIVAGVTGMRDNLVRFDGAAPFVPVKIFLAITLLVLTTTLAVTRWRKREVLWSPKTTILYLAGFAVSFLLAITLGFIGGVILYGV